ncbi:hypothetical protein LTR50_005930 [Elasticomyces elasticus]|nr:hypothetical protein LTR50_005930 [Elasticomyces elasticus]
MSALLALSPILPGVAIIVGALLSGAMFGYGLAIPVILDTNTSAAHLALQWARNFHYGHIMMPPISLVCCGMYIWAATKRSGAESEELSSLWK